LLEQNDLASATSSASTKLIHGGLRYLEQGALRLVHEALAEREVLLRNAPHLIRPLRFVLPHHDALRPAWQLRAGLFLYDRLGGREILPGTEVLDLTHGEVAVPLKRRYKLGFEYSDCRVDDSRLAVLNAVDAAERGALIRTRTRLARADRDELVWRLALKSRGGRRKLGRDHLSVPDRECILSRDRRARARGLGLCGRAAAARRSHASGQGHQPRLRAGARRAPSRGAAAHGVRRQDHHLSPA